eukprot:10365993-Alexandrium_andersonii.AAC.1
MHHAGGRGGAERGGGEGKATDPPIPTHVIARGGWHGRPYAAPPGSHRKLQGALQETQETAGVCAWHLAQARGGAVSGGRPSGRPLRLAAALVGGHDVEDPERGELAPRVRLAGAGDRLQ